MQMVAARARGDDFGAVSNTILDKLVTFLRAVRDMLGLKGFRSFDDVFEDITEGGFARAMDGIDKGRGDAYEFSMRHSIDNTSKLTPENVASLRERRRSGERVKDLAQEYGVTRETLSKALNGKTWQAVDN